MFFQIKNLLRLIREKKVKRDPVELGNVTQKVQNAILSVLDMYFACKCDEFTDSQIDSLDNMGTKMEAHIKVLCVAKCQKSFGPKLVSEDLVINPFTNICDIRFTITSELDRDGTNILKGCGVHRELFNDRLFGHSSLPSTKHLSQYLKRRWGNKVPTWNKLTKENTLCEFSIIRAASYQGSQDSGVGKGVIYATTNNSGKGKRYDYINVKVVQEENGEEVEGYAVAQVLFPLRTFL